MRGRSGARYKQTTVLIYINVTFCIIGIVLYFFQENPYERLLAKDLNKFFMESKLIAFFHANPIKFDDRFDVSKEQCSLISLRGYLSSHILSG